MLFDDVARLAAGGESETLEFKSTTGQLTRAGETLCAFLNARGGMVLIGVTPERKVLGQQVSDRTMQEISSVLHKIEPPHLVAHELTARQREILHRLAQRGPTPLREIRAAMENLPSDRTIQEDLAHLRRLRLIGSGGHGRGATYWLLDQDAAE